MNEPAATNSAPRTIGERLRAGRERAGLSVAAAAEKLHLDPKVIEALEADRFAELGAPVYVRGHLRRYADFVGEPGIEMVNTWTSREVSAPPPDLTQIPHAEARADLNRLTTPAVGLACAVVLVAAIWWVLASSRVTPEPTVAAPAAPPAPAETVAPPPIVAPPAAQLASKAVTPAQPTANGAAAATDPAALAAAEAARREAAAAARPTTLRLELSSESWVEVYDSRGERLFFDVASAGSVQSMEGRPPLRVVLGNAAGVTVQVNGQPREIPAAAVDGEGARFVVNRSGSLSRSR